MSPKRWEKARRLAGLEVPDDWVPSPEERLWLEELEALTPEEQQQLDRFVWTADDVVDVAPGTTDEL